MANIFSNIKERCLKIAVDKGISKELFFKNIGMTYGNFKGKAKETPLNSDTIANILTNFPDISPEWLLTGKGSMLRDGQATTPTPSLRVSPAISSPCPELLAEIEVLKATIAEKDRIISHLSKSMEAITTYINSLEKPLKNIPAHQKDLVEKSK